jgi:hypothetical protein
MILFFLLGKTRVGEQYNIDLTFQNILLQEGTRRKRAVEFSKYFPRNFLKQISRKFLGKATEFPMVFLGQGWPFLIFNIL